VSISPTFEKHSVMVETAPAISLTCRAAAMNAKVAGGSASMPRTLSPAQSWLGARINVSSLCSTFKASLAAYVLARVDRGEDQLAAMIPYRAADLLDYAPAAKQNLTAGAMSVADMCKAIVEISDNTCANLLLARIGGPAALTAFWRSIGDNTSRLDHNEPDLNRSPPGDPHDTTTPAAMAGNLRRLVLGNTLSTESRDQLTELMVNCKTDAARLRGGLPASWKIGDKTGNNGKDASGDIAVAWPRPDKPILIAAYTQGGAPSAEQLETVFANIGRMITERLA
jgi:beta-lactamase class A